MKKLVIVGSHRLSRKFAPFNDDSYDIWAIAHSAMAKWMRSYTAIIEIHDAILEPHPVNPGYWDLLQKTDVPVYMKHIDYRVKSAIKYPRKEITETLLKNITLNGESVEKFSSTIDYCIALGIYQGYKEIEIYGVEMRFKGEYQFQRPGFTFWVGLAAGYGVKVRLNCVFDLFENIYGERHPIYDKAGLKHINFRKEQHGEKKPPQFPNGRKEIS